MALIQWINPNILKWLSSKSGVKFVDELIREAIRLSASDIHFEPFESRFRIRFRIHGDLYTVLEENLLYYPVILTRVKILSELDIAQKRLPQDGRFSFNFKNRTIDLRASTIPTINGEKIVLRLLDPYTFAISMESLGLEKEEQQRINQSISRKAGIFLLSGTTNSGKTTTLYSLLKKIKGEKINVLTIEDPVEYRIDGINQVAVNTKAGLGFENALRAFLRQDPDVIMLGEVRDEATARLAIRAALTGHLVLGTIHTRDAVSVITRLRDLGIENYLLSASLIGIASQRLIKTLCPHCKAPYFLSEQEKYLVNQFGDSNKDADYYSPIGCHQCIDGYDGRQAVFEVYSINDEITRAISNGADEFEIQALMHEQGYRQMIENGMLAVQDGKTDMKEMMRKVYDA